MATIQIESIREAHEAHAVAVILEAAANERTRSGGGGFRYRPSFRATLTGLAAQFRDAADNAADDGGG